MSVCNLRVNAPTPAQLDQMCYAGLEPNNYLALVSLCKQGEYTVIFANVHPLFNGTYDRGEMHALNKRIESELALHRMAGELDPAYSHRELPSRVIGVITGSKPARVSKLAAFKEGGAA